EELEVIAFLFRELEEHALALRLLEALAVPLEEAMRRALTADADEQGLLVGAFPCQLFGARGKETVRRALEKQKRRLRLERRIAGDELAIARLQGAEMLVLLGGQLVEDLTPARIARQPRGARVEREAAALGRNGDAQGITREDRIRRRARARRGLAGA